MPDDKHIKQDSYTKAKALWDKRVGDTRVRLNSWRFACLVSMVCTLALVAIIALLINARSTYVYVAEVDKNNALVNIQTVPQKIVFDSVKQNYIIDQFLRNIMTVPLDPIILKKRWLNAYQLVAGNAVDTLNEYAQSAAPFRQVGNILKEVKIIDTDVISNRSIKVKWQATTYNMKGSIEGVENYKGTFTFSKERASSKVNLMNNPFGLVISYFTMDKEG